MRLKGSVGQGGRNLASDATYVQLLLADWQMVNSQQPIKVDGIVGPKTIAAIRAFQAKNIAVTDGLVEPNRSSIKALERSHLKVVMNVIASPVLKYALARRSGVASGVAAKSPDELFRLYLDALRGP